MMEKECFFLRKNFSSFKITSLPTWEGAKYAGGSRPSCLICTQQPAEEQQLIWNPMNGFDATVLEQC